jgi:hypothetical protein
MDQTVVGFDFSVISPGAITVCYEDRSNIQLHFEVINNELDSASGLVVDWFFTESSFGSVSFSDVISPGGTFVVNLPSISAPDTGHYSFQINVSSLFNGTVVQSDSLIIEFDVLPPLLVDDLQDTTLCPNVPLSLSLLSPYSAYMWSTGHITSSISVAGQGLFFVDVVDSFGCHGVDSAVITRFDAPEDILENDTVICEGDIIVSSVSLGFLNYLWNTGSDSCAILISDSGTFYVILEDTNACMFSDTLVVQTLDIPNSGLPRFTEICEGETVILGANPDFVSYMWNTGATSSSIPVNSNGEYIVTVLGGNGCIGVDTVSVSIRTTPNIVFNDSVMCDFNPYELKLGETFPEVQWSTGDTSSGLVVANPGWYHVTVTDELGCVGEDSIHVQNVKVEVDLGDDDTICTGSSFALFPQGKFDSYLWSDGTQGPTKVVTTTGVYSVTVTKNGCSNQDEVAVVVEDFPVPDFVTQVSSPDAHFTNLSNVQTNLIWDFGDGNFSTDINPYHQYAGQGIYPVTLSVSNSCGTFSKTLNVGIFPQSSGNITPFEGLLIFPTITTEILNFTFDGNYTREFEYRIFDVTGKLVRQSRIGDVARDFVYSVDVSQLATGTYFFRITDDSESFFLVKPFVKQ